MEVKFAVKAANVADLVAAVRPPLGGSGGAEPPRLEGVGFGGASPQTRGKSCLTLLPRGVY